METTRGAVALLSITLAVLALEVTHALRRRGPYVTIRFFGFALFFFMIKGLVDLPRLPDETPWQMHFALLKQGRFNYGVHLLLMPLLRTAAAYASFSAVHAWLHRRGHGDVRFYRFNALAVLGYCTLGVLIEIVNTATVWWTWNPEVINTESTVLLVAGWFAFWLVWGVGCFPAILVNFMHVQNHRRMWRWGIAYVLGYWIAIILVSAVAPWLRTPMVFALAAFELAGVFKAGGQRMMPLTATTPRPT